MKQLIFVALVLICATATSFAQSKIPTAVTSAFNKKFPNAANIKWDKENDHEYEADFTWKEVKHSANFSDAGLWLETETTLAFNQLPEKVQTAFNTAHKGATIKAAAKIETSKGKVTYEVEIKQGIKTAEFLYDANGSVLADEDDENGESENEND